MRTPPSRATVAATALAALSMAACGLELDPPRAVIHARFDPTASVVPMPNDLLRDDPRGVLDLPLDGDELSAADRELRSWLNTMDGWSSASEATVELTGPLNPATVDDETVQIWEWGSPPRRVTGLRVGLDDTRTELTVEPPEHGWERGKTYAILVRGGARGVVGEAGEPVECDAAFYFLRLPYKLDLPEHQRAFPGATRAERLEKAAELEEARVALGPYFSFFEERGIPRQDVAALWRFTVTRRTEIAMDASSQRMPIPFDLLLDPHTGLLDLPEHDGDSAVERNAKLRLREWDGFGVSANPMLETTAPVDPATVGPAAVELWELSSPARRLAADVRVHADLMHLEVLPQDLPLHERTRYGLVVRETLRDAAGDPVVPMPLGHLMRMRSEVADARGSQLSILDDEDAARVENVRARIAPLLDELGRDGVATAWPFTTQTVESRLREAMDLPADMDVPTAPEITRRMTPLEALADFPLDASLLAVETVYQGTLATPYFLDDDTRQQRPWSEARVERVRFTMTVPRGLSASTPVPTVIFGHGLMSEGRFVLAVGDALALRGMAAISIDDPYHGSRTACVGGGPLSVPDPRTGEVTSLPPCESGTTCNDHGDCVAADGSGGHLARWPLIGMPVASGAAFIDVDTIPGTRDHFLQALVDLAALSRSLREGDWQTAVGFSPERDRVLYAGQSLGGILGATFVALSPEVDRAVLNVPGCDLVDMFADSPFFGGQIDAFFTREGIEQGTWQEARFLNLGRLIVDAIDPQSVAHLLRGRNVFVQMALLDFIIPNPYTEQLVRLSGAPKRDYLAEHGFIVVPVEPAYPFAANDLAEYLAGRLTP